MNRRKFLTAISALPFLGFLKPDPDPYWDDPISQKLLREATRLNKKYAWPAPKNAYFPTELVKLETDNFNKEFYGAMFPEIKVVGPFTRDKKAGEAVVYNSDGTCS